MEYIKPNNISNFTGLAKSKRAVYRHGQFLDGSLTFPIGYTKVVSNLNFVGNSKCLKIGCFYELSRLLHI